MSEGKSKRMFSWMNSKLEVRDTEKKGKGVFSNEEITKFDIEYEAKRKEGDDSEPGEDIDAPYHTEHMFSEKIEKLLAEECKIDWGDYCKYTNRFSEKK